LLRCTAGTAYVERFIPAGGGWTANPRAIAAGGTVVADTSVRTV